MNPIEDIFVLGDEYNPYRVEVRPTRYNPVARANQHSVQVFIGGTDIAIGRGTVNSARRSYTQRKAEDIIAGKR